MIFYRFYLSTHFTAHTNQHPKSELSKFENRIGRRRRSAADRRRVSASVVLVGHVGVIFHFKEIVISTRFSGATFYVFLRDFVRLW